VDKLEVGTELYRVEGRFNCVEQKRNSSYLCFFGTTPASVQEFGSNYSIYCVADFVELLEDYGNPNAPGIIKVENGEWVSLPRWLANQILTLVKRGFEEFNE